MPSLDGRADLLGQRRLELGRGRRERLEPVRARARARPRRRPASARPSLRLGEPLPAPARVRLDPSAAKASVRRRMKRSELDYELPPELIAQHPARAARRVAAARLRPRDAATCATAGSRELPDELARRARRRQRHARRAGADPRSSGRRRRGAAARARSGDGDVGGARAADAAAAAGRRYGPVELLEHLGEGRWRAAARGRAGRRGAAAAVHHRAARRPGALPDRLRATRRARPRRRRPGCTSRRSCSRGSTSSA